jgi:uncharacterized membrane-anchored protein
MLIYKYINLNYLIMGALIEVLLKVLAGMGIAWAADKYLPGQMPTYQPVGIGFNLKTVVIVVCCVTGAILLVWLMKTLHIRLFKTKR